MKLLENITFYKDRNFKQEFGLKYSIEIINDKARAINPYGGVFGMKEKSRLNKLHWLGKGSTDYYYTLIVEGVRVFFKSNNTIF